MGTAPCVETLKNTLYPYLTVDSQSVKDGDA